MVPTVMSELDQGLARLQILDEEAAAADAGARVALKLDQDKNTEGDDEGQV